MHCTFRVPGEGIEPSWRMPRGAFSPVLKADLRRCIPRLLLVLPSIRSRRRAAFGINAHCTPRTGGQWPAEGLEPGIGEGGAADERGPASGRAATGLSRFNRWKRRRRRHGSVGINRNLGSVELERRIGAQDPEHDRVPAVIEGCG
jgi:hypothetical protein